MRERRPILKVLPFFTEAASNPLPFSSCSTILDSPHVHFPPTPTLTSTAITHSRFTYDRAPIVVAPNLCALPERGGRNFIGGNIIQGGLGYFHPHARFQVDTVRVERDSSETVSPAIFSASVSLGNGNDCGTVGLFKKKQSRPMYEDEEQYSSHNQYILDASSASSDLGVFYPSAPYVPTPSSPWNVSDTLAVPPSPRSAASNITVTPPAKHLHKRKSSADISGKKKRRKDTAEGESRTGGWTGDSNSGFELEGCLGGF